jgi:hypothetical protein
LVVTRVVRKDTQMAGVKVEWWVADLVDLLV